MMHRWKTTPQETLKRMVTSAQQYLEGQPTPAPGDEEEEDELPTGTTKPRPAAVDPIPWLVDHKEYWPKEVILREAQEFPAVSNGKVAGSLKVPAGATVQVSEITRQDMAVFYMGGQRRLPIGATDLAFRASAALAKAERESKRKVAAAPTATPSTSQPSTTQPDKIREATREEISKGLGAMYTHKATTFRIFAPTAKALSVVLYSEHTGDEGRTIKPLRQQSNGLWDTTVRGDLHGKFYTYLLDANDPKRAREVLDPYAVNSVANSTRARITPLTAPPPSLGLADNAGAAPHPTDAIIYEMHVRDFTIAPNSGVKDAGLYLGWTEERTRLADAISSSSSESAFPSQLTPRASSNLGSPGSEPKPPQPASVATGLDHLTELGVTHVQILPVHDFENDEESRAYNWGYITQNFFSPEGMFATNPNDHTRVGELKALIGALHARGIGVILDVVYNHTSGKASLFDIAPDYYYRRGADGALSNGSGCGNEVKSESPMARRLIIDSLKYWVKEYGVDGFRFDLMALLDQETMRQADRELRKINPNIILYGEPWMAGGTPLRDKTDKSALRQMPVGAFNDDFRNALKGMPDGNEPGWIQNGSNRDGLKSAMRVSDWFASPAQSINYMTCHDNLVLWDKLEKSMPDTDAALRKETMKLGYLALFTSQGVPFIHGGEEFGRTKFGNHNSYEAPDSVNQVDWALKREHFDLFNYVRDLIALRKAHPMFRLRTRPEVQVRVNFIDTPNREVLLFTINGEGVPGEIWKRACVILNSGDTADAAINLPPGEWRVALDAAGTATASQVVSGKFNVRHKSGAVLYQP